MARKNDTASKTDTASENGLTDRGLLSVFVSHNTGEDGTDIANVVDVIDRIALQVGKVANAITPLGVAPGRDGHGGRVESLTEAVMSVGTSLDGIARGLESVAGALESIAEAVRHE
jgi:hypothetical protein